MLIWFCCCTRKDALGYIHFMECSDKVAPLTSIEVRNVKYVPLNVFPCRIHDLNNSHNS